MQRTILFILVLFIFIQGCENSTEPDKPEEQISVSIEFIGHSSFMITVSDSIKILTDPYGTIVSFLNWPDSVECDAITVSHQHADHNQARNILGNPRIFANEVTDSVGIVHIESFRTTHGRLNGAYMGDNFIFVFRVGDYKIVHLGETAAFSSHDILEAIRKADVMIVPTGEVASVSFDEIKQLTDSTNTKIIIPSHFSPDAARNYYGSSTLADYINYVDDFVPVTYSDSLVLSGDAEQNVVVLSTPNMK